MSKTQVPTLSRYTFSIESDGWAWLVSTRSGAIARIAPNAFEKTLEDSSLEATLHELEFFKECSSEDELDDIQASIDAAKTKVGILPVTVAPTLGCNFSCAYCFERKTSDYQSKRRWTEETRNNVLSYIVSNLRGRSGLFLRWFGGEPLLAMQEVESLGTALRSICEQAGLRFASRIQTNGMLLNDASVESMLRAGISEVHITLDGDEDRHNRIRHLDNGDGSFSRIIENVNRFAKRFRSFQIRVNVVPSVAKNIDQILSRVAAIDPTRHVSIYASPIYHYFNGDGGSGNASSGFGSVRDYAEAELRILQSMCNFKYPFDWGYLDRRSLACSALKADGLMIGPRGEIVKCDHEFGVPEATIGTVKTGVTDIDGLSSWLSVNPRNNPNCSTCVLLPTCGGYCESIRRTVSSADEACPSKKFNFKDRTQLGIRHEGWADLDECDFLVVRNPRKNRMLEEAK